MKVEKSGMLINKEKQVIGWVNAGEDADLKDGDTIVSHHKTAEKMGLAEEFKQQKADNTPVKEEKPAGEKKERGPRGPRKEIPKTGTYSVVKADFKAIGGEGGRAAVFKILAENTRIEAFLEQAKPYTHTKRDNTTREVPPGEVFAYAIKRGMITVDA